MTQNNQKADLSLSPQIDQGLILAFGELFLKSAGVQKILKQRLVNHLSFTLKKYSINFKIFPLRERIFVKTENIRQASSIVKNIFGLSWFAKAIFLEGATLSQVANFVRDNYHLWIRPADTFALQIRKGSSIDLSREEIIQTIARSIQREVNLNRPKKEIFVEARKNGWFIYFKKQKGAGGLPVGSQGKVLTLISGGIDSPVAAYLITKRGAENIWIHFHSFPLVSQKSIEKTKELAKIFSAYQRQVKIHLIPFVEIQKEIKLKVPAKYRVIFYRKLMLEIAQRIARKENCLALVTGESLGQVSSQTLANLSVAEEKITMPVLRPLIGWDKEEIIDLAQKIKTFDISVQPQEDCCTLFVPAHQTALAKKEVVNEYEKKLNLGQLISRALAQAALEVVE